MKNRSYFVTLDGEIVCIAFKTLTPNKESLGNCLFRCVEDNIYDLWVPVFHGTTHPLETLKECFDLYKRGINTIKATIKDLLFCGFGKERIMFWFNKLEQLVMRPIGKLKALDDQEYCYKDENLYIEVSRYRKTGDRRTGKFQVYLQWLDGSIQDTEYFENLNEATDFVNELIG